MPIGNPFDNPRDRNVKKKFVQEPSQLSRKFPVVALLLVVSWGVITGSVGCRGKSSVGTTNARESADKSNQDSIASITGLAPQDAKLSEDRQKEVWAAEHATHVIEHRFGVRFKKLLRSQSLTGLAELVRPTADIELVDAAKSIETTVGTFRSFHSLENAGTRSANGQAFSKWLLDLHRTLGSDAKFALRVLAIKAQGNTQEPTEQSWVADLLLKGTAKYGERGTRQIQSKHRAVLQWRDIEQLENLACIESWKAISVHIGDAPRKLMAEVTKSARLDAVPIQDNWRLPAGRAPQMIRFQMAVEDYDRDGLLDIAVSSAGNNYLLKFNGKQFRPVTSSGIHPASRGQHVDISAGWIDYDNDDDPDLILGGRVYENDAGNFVDMTERSGIEFHPHHMGCAVADYDVDGFNDVYFIYSHDRTPNAKSGKAWIGDDESGGQNQLWRNNGDGTFTDVTESTGVGGGKRQSFASTWLYADDDHYPDLYVANDFGTNSLFRNRGDGTFEDASNTAGVSDFATSMGVASGDLDNDGTPEIYVANMYSKMGRRIVGQVRDSDYPDGVYPRLQGACAGSRLYRLGEDTQDSAAEFSLAAGVNQVGWAYAPAIADFNNDGMLDMYATCGFISVDRKKPDG